MYSKTDRGMDGDEKLGMLTNRLLLIKAKVSRTFTMGQALF